MAIYEGQSIYAMEHTAQTKLSNSYPTGVRTGLCWGCVFEAQDNGHCCGLDLLVHTLMVAETINK